MTNIEIFSIESKLNNLINIIKKLESAEEIKGGGEDYAIPIESVKFDLANTVSKHPVYECYFRKYQFF